MVILVTVYINIQSNTPYSNKISCAKEVLYFLERNKRKKRNCPRRTLSQKHLSLTLTQKDISSDII